jgi:glycosyltransferase involved in cell wall biosynthesis
MTGLVSVIIPTYNRAELVSRAIESALAQTYANIEVIVVDDGSTDGTEQILSRRYGHEPRVIYLRQENKGVSAARNVGLRAARGDYVALLDSDDVWKPWKIELQISCLQRFPEAGMIWTDMEAVGPEGSIVSPRYLRTMYRAAYRWFPTNDALFSLSEPLAEVWPPASALDRSARVYVGDIAAEMVMGNLVHTSTVLLRRERFERVGGFDERLSVSGEDFDFHLRTCQIGPVAFADIAGIQYRTGAADQLTRPEYQIYLAANFLRTIEPVLDREKSHNRLPPFMLETVQAEAHAWLGRELLAHGDPVGARKHLAESLRHRAFAPPTWLLFALSCGPKPAYPLAKGMVRAVRRAVNQIRRRNVR